MPGVALFEIAILWLAIVSTILIFYSLLPLAAFLLVPYLLWVSYAAYLNLGIWRMNRP
jgi:tryptophan-rich sensory protein